MSTITTLKINYPYKLNTDGTKTYYPINKWVRENISPSDQEIWQIEIDHFHNFLAKMAANNSIVEQFVTEDNYNSTTNVIEPTKVGVIRTFTDIDPKVMLAEVGPMHEMCYLQWKHDPSLVHVPPDAPIVSTDTALEEHLKTTLI